MGGSDEASVPASGHLTVPEVEWEKARGQAGVIARLARYAEPSLAAADEAAAELAVSRRQVFVLLGRFRAGSGLVTDLMPGRSNGGRGRSRLDGRVETIITETVRKRYVTRQKRSISVVYLSGDPSSMSG